jgi:hypothetical protein
MEAAMLMVFCTLAELGRVIIGSASLSAPLITIGAETVPCPWMLIRLVSKYVP